MNARTMLTVAGVAGLVIGGCSSPKKAATDADETRVNAALVDGKGAPTELAAAVERDAIELQKALHADRAPKPVKEQATLPAAIEPPPERHPEPPRPSTIKVDRTPVNTSLAATGQSEDPASAPAAPGPAPAPVTTPPKTPQQRYVDAANEIEGQLRDRISADRSPWSAALALVALETIRPGVMTDLNESGSPLAAKLSPAERRSLSAIRDLMVAANPTDTDPGDPAKLAGVMAESAKKLNPSAAPAAPSAVAGQALSLPRTLLATRVDGYGQYDSVTTNVFTAGRSHRVIVYVEVDGFAHRPQGELWAAELGQELQLIAEPSGTQQWYRPEQAVRDTSRNKRRDFFLVQQVELPATLGAGSYTLKVRVRDKVSGQVVEGAVGLTVVSGG